jgi:hypothetical protein
LFSIFNLSLASGLFAWLPGILLQLLLLYIVEFICQVAYHSMHFLFRILKIQKKIGILHWLAFLSLIFIISLAHLAKDCILLLNCIFEIEDCTVFISISFIEKLKIDFALYPYLFFGKVITP